MPWLQWNVALARVEGRALPSARRVFGALLELLEPWRAGARLERFFFQRKPPDLRLRFQGADPGSLEPELAGVFDSLRAAGTVLDSFPSVYEPEWRLFGGHEAMEIAHAHFEADSLGWIDLDRLEATGRRSVPISALLAAVWNDLFYRSLGDASEIWDAWCNLADLAGSSSDPASVEELRDDLDDLAARARPDEAEALRGYARANEALAGGLAALWGAGRLLTGLRGMLPFVAMFQANRHGVRGPEQSAIARGMARVWDPRRDLRGG